MRLKEKQGFTLLELLVTLSIVGIILLGFFRVINSTIKISTKNDRDIKALHIAQSELEKVRSELKNTSSGNVNINNKTINISTDKLKESFNYNVKNDNELYNVNLKLKNIKEFEDKLYLVKADVEVKLKDQFFSKKSTKLETTILSGNGINKEGDIEYEEGTSYIRYSNGYITFGHYTKEGGTQERTEMSPSRGFDVEKISIYYEKNPINNEVVLYMEFNGQSFIIKDLSFRDNYYPCKGVAISLKSKENNKKVEMSNIIINGIKVKDRLETDLIEGINSEYIIDRYNDELLETVKIEFDAILNDDIEFTIRFGKEIK